MQVSKLGVTSYLVSTGEGVSIAAFREALQRFCRKRN